MDYKEAKEILEHHNLWRKGEDLEMISPAKITTAIDTAIKLLKAFEEPVSKCDPPIIPDVQLSKTQEL